MSSKWITRDTLDGYLREVAREIRKEFGKLADVEMVLVGGAAILTECHFRDSTMDIDALIVSRSSIKGIVNRVGDRKGLPNGWLNQDFVKTVSYSPKIREFSKYYHTYSGVLHVRTMAPDYIVAMKMMSFRPYKNDRSDIAGVLSEHALSEQEITGAFMNLYPNHEIPAKAMQYVRDCLNKKIKYDDVRMLEYDNKVALQSFEAKYENALKADNLDEILEMLQNKEKNSEQN